MTVAFDLDETLTAFPQQLSDMFNRLSADGAIILTGNCGGVPNAREKERLAQECGAHVTSHDIVIVEACTQKEGAKNKAEYCRDHDVSVLIDDDEGYLRRVQELSPDTVCLLVLPKRR